MLFKGTRTRGLGAVERELRSYGGIINGAASPDFTEVTITVQTKNLPQALAILKDIFLNASFEPAELDKEKEVIANEIRLHDDEPASRLYKNLSETAYIRHPYRFPAIGYEKNLRALTRQDVIKYYNRMYVPNRIIIAIAGGKNPEEATRDAEDAFKDFRAANYDSSWDKVLTEPPQITARESSEEIQTDLAYSAMAYHSTSILDEDLFSMDVLAMILGRGDNSRLNNSLLKDKRLVHSISCWNYTPRDPGLFVITAVADPARLKTAENAVRSEIDRIRKAGVTDEELRAAKQKVLADYIFSRETMEEACANLAANYALTSDYDFSSKYVDGINSVSKDDVKRVCSIYLLPESLTTTRLLPPGSLTQKTERATQPAADAIVKKTLPNGLRILLRENKRNPTVSVSIAMLGGLMAESPSKNGISSLTACMLLKGTSKRKEARIAGAIEDLGGSISAFSGFNSFGLNMELLSPDLVTGLDIIKDVLNNSVFPQDEIDKSKAITIAMTKEEDDDIFKKGSDAVRNLLFPDLMYGLRYLGTEESVKNISRADIISFYRNYCVPENMVISISGDIDKAALEEKINLLFGDMKGAAAPFPDENLQTAKKTARRSFTMDKDQSLVMLGFRTTGALDPERYVFEVMDSILSGFGRLYTELRDKRSLSYTQGCAQKSALKVGYFIFYAATTRQKVTDVKNNILLVINDSRRGGITDEEIALAKKSLASTYLENLQTNSFFSQTSALDELYGLGYDNLFKYESEVSKVTRQDIKRAADKYFDPDSCAEVEILSEKPGI